MNWFTGSMVYIVIWWLIWFIALPIGVERDDNPSPLHSTGAPKEIKLKKKFWATTLLSALVTLCIVYFVTR